MNNIFDIKRFGNYFLYDLRNAKNNYGISLLICGTLPIIVFVFAQLLSLIFQQQFMEMQMIPKLMQLGIAYTIVLLGAGAKIYGNLTEKRAGSNFLMLPASTLEKWLSMVLIVCIVLPAALLALQLGSDALMSLLFPNHYGDRVLELDFLQGFKDGLIDNGINIKFELLFFLDWVGSILVFVLGALCFKKSKVGKTILCLFAFSTVFSTIAMILVGHSGPTFISFFDFEATPIEAVKTFNWFMSIYFIVVIGGLLGGIYYRLRTLKH